VSRLVTVSLPSAGVERAQTLVREVTEESYPNATPGKTITVLRDPVLSTMNFGEHPTVSFWFLVEVVLVVLICFSLAARDRPDARWYLESKLVEQGSGRLPDVQPVTENSLSEIRALVDQEFSKNPEP